jgi:ADP-ribosylglycohydrolase
MLGAIAGDIIGSVFEGVDPWDWRGYFHDTRTPRFEPLFHRRSRFTDDTVLTVAVAEHLLGGGYLVDLLKTYARAYPNAGYGGTFRAWARSDDRRPYNSWGNGSAMRASPVGFACDTLDAVLAVAQRTAEVTHDHPEGIKGAQATAAAVFLARTGHDKEDIRAFIERKFHYDLGRPLDDLRPTFGFDVSCRGTVPPALRAFLESTDYEHAVRLAVSLGGDADTLACITGSVAHAYYGGVPTPIREQALARLDERLRAVVEEFEARFPAAGGL